jgi:hypothetical protein
MLLNVLINKVEPLVSWMVIKTLISMTFSTIKLLVIASKDKEVCAVMIPIGILIIELSIKVMDLTF